MIEQGYKFIFLDTPKELEPFLQNDFLPHGSIWSPALPLNETETLSLLTFLNLYKPTAVIYFQRIKNRDTSFEQVLIENFAASPTLLVSVNQTGAAEFEPGPFSNNLKISVPENVLAYESGSLVRSLLEKLTTRRRFHEYEVNPFFVITARLISKMLLKSALAALANPQLQGSYSLSNNGSLNIQKTLELLTETLNEFRPELKLARWEVRPNPKNNSIESLCGPERFEEAFEIILPSARDAIREETAYYLAHQ